MSVALSVRGVNETVANLRRGSAEFRAALRRQIETETILLERDLKARSLTGQKGSHPLWGVTGASGDALGARTGHTRRSVVRRVFEAGGAVIGVVGSALKQMKLHEDGGTIHGKPYLRIPTRAMQTGAGVDRLAGQSIRNQPGMFLFRSANRRSLWAAFRSGAQLVLAYLLVREVKLRARRPFAAALKRNEAGILARMRVFTALGSARMNGAR